MSPHHLIFFFLWLHIAFSYTPGEKRMHGITILCISPWCRWSILKDQKRERACATYMMKAGMRLQSAMVSISQLKQLFQYLNAFDYIWLWNISLHIWQQRVEGSVIFRQNIPVRNYHIVYDIVIEYKGTRPQIMLPVNTSSVEITLPQKWEGWIIVCLYGCWMDIETLFENSASTLTAAFHCKDRQAIPPRHAKCCLGSRIKKEKAPNAYFNSGNLIRPGNKKCGRGE